MNPSALEDLWTAVRLAAEGSDWKRDQGETLTAWAQRTLRAQRAEEGRSDDTARLDFLADITNLSALRDFGKMLNSTEVSKIEKAAAALSVGYELHRRTKDTPEAFRAAVDDARAGPADK